MTSAPPATWGNPIHKTFASRYIRLVAVEEIRVKVHTVLQPVVERLLSDLAEADLVLESIDGYPASPAGQGLVLQIAAMDDEATTAAMERYGFKPDPDLAHHYVWAGSYEQAAAGAVATTDGATDQDGGDSEAQEEPATAEPLPTADQDTEGWYDGLPGSRTLVNGEDYLGRDVLFLQAYLVVEQRTGIYDAPTVAAVAAFKARRGLAADGSMDTEGWRQFLPRLRRRVSHGDGGRTVRILSAALIAAGLQGRDERVAARYTSAISRLVRAWQHDGKRYATGVISTIDWDMLLHNPWRS